MTRPPNRLNAACDTYTVDWSLPPGTPCSECGWLASAHPLTVPEEPAKEDE